MKKNRFKKQLKASVQERKYFIHFKVRLSVKTQDKPTILYFPLKTR